MKLPEFTIVVSIGGHRYLELFLRTYKTWRLKEELANAALIVFTNGVSPEYFQGIRPHKTIPWALSGQSLREQMISAFVFASKYVTTEFYLKIDVDCFFTNDQPLLTQDLFDFDITAHGWGYTKPAAWLNSLNEWAQERNLPGESRYPFIEENLYKHSRFTSWLCLHRTSFVLRCLEYCGDRLPVPSHDTFLWFMADRMGVPWKGINFKERGAGHSKKFALNIK